MPPHATRRRPSRRRAAVNLDADTPFRLYQSLPARISPKKTSPPTAHLALFVSNPRRSSLGFSVSNHAIAPSLRRTSLPPRAADRPSYRASFARKPVADAKVKSGSWRGRSLRGPDPSSHAKDKTEALSWTDHTSSSFDDNGSLSGDELPSPESLASCRRSVRFSYVQVREYSVVEEPKTMRLSLGWDYTDKGRSDLLVPKEEEHDGHHRYLRAIQDPIHREECRWAEAERKEQPRKRKGFRASAITTLRRVVATGRVFASVMPTGKS